MDFITKNTANYLVKPFLKWYLKRVRPFNYDDFYFEVFPTVFHPSFFFSTKFLMEFIAQKELKGKSFCEPGCGSGVISVLAAYKGASVTAFDINAVAVENIKHNINLNQSLLNNTPRIHVTSSDLFDNIPAKQFDVIVINPPYFFDDAATDAQKAWYCGKNGEYFKKLFYQLNDFSSEKSDIYIILADNCDLTQIKEIASCFGFYFELMMQKKIWWETNFIYRIIIKKE